MLRNFIGWRWFWVFAGVLAAVMMLQGVPSASAITDDPLNCGAQGLTYDQATQLCLPTNPLKAAPGSIAASTSIGGLLKTILNILLTLAGVVAVVFIVIGGYQYITSQGNEDKAKAGRKNLTYAIIGLIIILLAFVLVTVITNLFVQGSPFGADNGSSNTNGTNTTNNGNNNGNTNGTGTFITVLNYNGTLIPESEFKLAQADQGGCLDAHWHAAVGTKVVSINGDSISDPAPQGCGFGTVTQLTSQVVEAKK